MHSNVQSTFWVRRFGIVQLEGDLRSGRAHTGVYLSDGTFTTFLKGTAQYLTGGGGWGEGGLGRSSSNANTDQLKLMNEWMMEEHM